MILTGSLSMQGPKPSDKLLEVAAKMMADAFIQGEMCISDWSAEKGTKIKVFSKFTIVIYMNATVLRPSAHIGPCS